MVWVLLNSACPRCLISLHFGHRRDLGHRGHLGQGHRRDLGHRGHVLFSNTDLLQVFPARHSAKRRECDGVEVLYACCLSCTAIPLTSFVHSCWAFVMDCHMRMAYTNEYAVAHV